MNRERNLQNKNIMFTADPLNMIANNKEFVINSFVYKFYSICIISFKIYIDEYNVVSNG
jgi:hypothetical protein